MTHSITFEKLANRLRDLVRRQSPPTPRQARDEINALCAQAIVAYKHCAETGLAGFDEALVRITLTGDGQQDQIRLLNNDRGQSRWLDIVRHVSQQFPGRIAGDPGAPDRARQQRPNIEVSATSGPGYTWTPHDVDVRTYPLENWPQRACEYADVMDYLSALANQADPEAVQLPSRATEANRASSHQSARQDRATSQLKWLAKAMLLVREHPDWPDAEIARFVGKNPGTLSRSREYKAAAALARDSRSNLPRGYINAHPDSGMHDVEAVDNHKSDNKSDRGHPIPGSTYVREYCSDCGEPIKVTADQVGKYPKCHRCTD